MVADKKTLTHIINTRTIHTVFACGRGKKKQNCGLSLDQKKSICGKNNKYMDEKNTNQFNIHT